MSRSWKRALERDPRIVQPRLLRIARMRALAKDRQFLIETEALKKRFEEVLSTKPRALKQFFRKYSDPTVFPHLFIKDFLKGITSSTLRSLYNSYFAYVYRFGVFFILRVNQKRHFKVTAVAPWGSKFHVRLIDNTLHPGGGYPGIDEPFDYFFESPRLEVSAKLEKLIASHKAKAVRVDDESLTSILSKFEQFAYDPEAITFLLHNAEQPYLFCLIGEKVSAADWRKADSAVTTFFKEHYLREKRGRTGKLLRFKRALRLPEEGGSLKVRAAKLERGDLSKDGQTAQAYAIRVKKLLEQRKIKT